MSGLLDRSRCIAPLNYDRWRVPPAALAIHLSLGQAFAFGVFHLPLSRVLGVTESLPGDWSIAAIGWISSLAVVVLGLSSFALGGWVEDAGPRKATFASASCLGGGLLVAALGVQIHQIWIVYLGYGVIGGTGLGLGYLSPISALIKWFPDRPGAAAGLALTGVVGGAMIGAPLAGTLMASFATASDTGVALTFVAMGILYFAFMMFGVFTVRLPSPDWLPETFTAKVIVEPGSGPRAPRLGTLAGRSLAERKQPAPDVHVEMAMKTRQFWLLWIVLFANIVAGIGILGQAAPMIRRSFPFTVSAVEAAGFVGLLSLAMMLGCLAWSSLSDQLGRKRTYTSSLAFGAALCALVPSAGASGSLTLFVITYAAMSTMLGGGVATLPAYLRDTFGVMHLSAIHGRLLTACSVAVVSGPLLTAYLRESQLARGASEGAADPLTMYLMAAFLLVGLAANALVSPVGPKYQVAPPSGFRG